MAIALAIKVPVGEIKMSKAAASVATVAMKRHVYPSAMPAKSPMERVAAEFDRIGMSVTCRKGQMLVREGDPAEHVFKVTSGALTAVRLLLNGRRHIGNFLMPGDFFGPRTAHSCRRSDRSSGRAAAGRTSCFG